MQLFELCQVLRAKRYVKEASLCYAKKKTRSKELFRFCELTTKRKMFGFGSSAGLQESNHSFVGISVLHLNEHVHKNITNIIIFGMTFNQKI